MAAVGLGRIVPRPPSCWTPTSRLLLEPNDGRRGGGLQRHQPVPRESSRSGSPHRAGPGDGVNATTRRSAALGTRRYEPATVRSRAWTTGRTERGRIHGGTAGNVVPDSCAVEINYRFAPDKTVDQAHDHVRSVLADAGVGPDAIEVTDASPAARPGLDHPAAAAFVAAVGGEPMPKYGWTDVARFSALGVPAVNIRPRGRPAGTSRMTRTSRPAQSGPAWSTERWLVPQATYGYLIARAGPSWSR